MFYRVFGRVRPLGAVVVTHPETVGEGRILIKKGLEVVELHGEVVDRGRLQRIGGSEQDPELDEPGAVHLQNHGFIRPCGPRPPAAVVGAQPVAHPCGGVRRGLATERQIPVVGGGHPEVLHGGDPERLVVVRLAVVVVAPVEDVAVRPGVIHGVEVAGGRAGGEM